MNNEMTPATETGFDRALGFTLPDRDSRGRVVRLGPVLAEILSAHDYCAPVKRCLSEALVVTALMGSLLKEEDDQLTVQAQSEDGLIKLMVCDYRSGELRGYAEQSDGQMDGLGQNPRLEDLFGKGHLAVTFDIAKTKQRYQGIVPLEGASISEAMENYFAQSEQLPTKIFTASRDGDAAQIGAGFLAQYLPEGEEGQERLHVRDDAPEWEHVAILSETLTHEELVDPALSLEAIVWRLFHEESEIRVEPGAPLSKGCRCTVVHFENVLSRFPKTDRQDMANEAGIILVDCAFCSKQFAIQD